jgi:Fe2+ or Zn2+ uptake regulation protein
MGFFEDRIGPAGWWLRVAPPFYPPSFWARAIPKRGGNGHYFQKRVGTNGVYLDLIQITWHNRAVDVDVKELLRKASLRLTAPRLAVLDVVELEGKHRDAEFIAAAARRRLGSVSRQSVYDNLNALVAAGIIRRIEPAGRPALYETRVGDNHHHLICRRCQATVDIDCAVGDSPCLQPSDDHGFVIDEAEVVYWGLCPSCQRNH